MKYFVLIGDGMSDLPLKQLKGKTPLEVAKTPNLDFLAQNGACGWVNNVPKSMKPASDVANMSIFGYDPKRYYTGRGPLEAASLGVKLAKDEVAFRCNLVTVQDRKMKDFTAGHIKTSQASRIMRFLNKKLGNKEIKLYPGLSYRNLLVIKRSLVGDALKTTPPHDITGQKILNYLPQGKGSQLLLQLMNESEVLLHEIKTKATMIWPWSQGRVPSMPSFSKKFGKRGAIITAVHLLKGLGKILGMQVINVPGATGYIDTNYKGKADYAIRSLKKNNVVIVHVEAPDEAGHEGDIRKKVKAIEDFDAKVVGTVLNWSRLPSSPDCRIIVLPDHPTPIKVMTHTADAVPFVIFPSPANSPAAAYNERAYKNLKLRLKNGHELLGKVIKNDL